MDYVNDENYINIQGWMRKKLNLKGNDLLVYAIIYGFSQTENQRFTGSLQYLAEWCGATKQGILKNLKSLIDKNLIQKKSYIINGVRYCEYSCIPLNIVEQGIKQSCIGVLNKVERGIKHSLTNNIDNTIDKDNIDNTIDNNSQKLIDVNCCNPIEEVVAIYNNVCVSLPKINRITDKRKKAVQTLFKKGYTVADFKEAFEIAEQSDFLKGKNDRGWKANFDFFLREDKLVKILERDYGGSKKSYDGLPGNDGKSKERKQDMKRRIANGELQRI